MPTLSAQANAVLQEFGGLLDESLCSFEDAKREFLYTRALEMQKLGIANTNKTVTYSQLDVSARDGALTLDTIKGLIPAAVEFQPTNTTDRLKVTIVQVDDIPNYEGGKAIAFYDEPLRYRLSFDSWTYGTLHLFYDEVEDLADLSGTSSLKFPLAFWTFLTKKTAFNIIDTVRLKLLWHARAEEKEQTDGILLALKAKEAKLAAQVEEWQREFRRWINQDLAQGAHTRRTIIEIAARDYNDAGVKAFDSYE